MLTTFARIGKILNGEIQPKNWIERAFAELVSSISNVLPSFTISDEDKVLTVGKDDGHLVNVNIINLQNVELNATSKGRLATDSFDFSSLVESETLTMMVDNTPISCKVISGAIWSADEENIYVSTSGIVNLSSLDGYANKTVAMNCSKSATVYEPVLEWGEASGGNGDIEIVHFTMSEGGSVRADKTVTEIYEASQSGKLVLAMFGPLVGTAQNITSDTAEFTICTFNPGSPGNFTAGVIVYTGSGVTMDTGNITCDS